MCTHTQKLNSDTYHQMEKIRKMVIPVCFSIRHFSKIKMNRKREK